MSRRLLILAYVSAALTGCTGSRWARSDADYARKYSQHSDNPLRMLKHAVDARFIRDRTGCYTSVAGGTEPATASAEISAVVMPTSWLETRAGATGIVGAPGNNLYRGVNLGVRVHSPSRLAPFIGVGGYAGKEPWQSWNDDDVLSSDSERDNSDIVLAAYPELGTHLWLTPRWRLTTSASYYLGWGEEPWFFSIGLANVPGPKTPPPAETWIDDWQAEGTAVDVSAKSLAGSSASSHVAIRLPPVDSSE